MEEKDGRLVVIRRVFEDVVLIDADVCLFTIALSTFSLLFRPAFKN